VRRPKSPWPSVRASAEKLWAAQTVPNGDRLDIERTAGKDYTTLAGAIAPHERKMPRRAKGPHLWLRPERRDAAGRITHDAVWIIKDRGYQRSTECSRSDLSGAETALTNYLAEKHTKAAKRLRDPAAIPVLDVLNLYAEHVAPGHARPLETKQRILRLAAFFKGDRLRDINGERCRAFIKHRGTRAGAREDLSLLRAAINFHREEGYHDRIISVVLPEKGAPRDRWITRREAARLILNAWRYREVQKGHATGRRSRRHVAKFVLVGLYTGTRAGAICAASFKPIAGYGYVDVDRGVFYRRAPGERVTKKRKPPVPIPRRLLAHLRRWKARGQRFVVEWNGDPVHDCDKAFRANAQGSKLPDVTPHTLRHTAATWQMQAGTDLWEAAGFLGMSPEMLDRVYGHHHPRHLSGARDAFDRMAKERGERKGAATVSPPISRNKTRLNAVDRAKKLR
jgi:integrase